MARDLQTAIEPTMAKAQELKRLLEPLMAVEQQLEQFRRVTAEPIESMLRQHGQQREQLSQLAKTARAQTRISSEVAESARRLALPATVIRGAELSRREAEEALHEVVELQELEAAREEDAEEGSGDLSARLVEQSERQTELSQRQLETFQGVLEAMNTQIVEGREREAEANVKWRWSTGITVMSLLVAILSLISTLN
ncbi:hypothetical protein [Nocardiopsis alba]|uniref:Uncharacterized protein n=1 Tax=Nocardiopsis alba TaxID=53437 RepID=A0A7K2ILV4_9ACTN|nr:hypothetical protein [Nocardiopsis alba]MYR30754.1 hypothetical protein [Nocardiopsis alba]